MTSAFNRKISNLNPSIYTELLKVLNIIGIVFGLTFTVIGSLSLVPDSLIIHFIEKIGLGEIFKSEAKKKVFSGFLGFVNDYTTSLFLIGLTVLCVSTFGLFVAVTKKRTLLIVYLGLLVFLMFGHTVALIIYTIHRHKPPESLVTNMKNLAANFVSESSEDAYSKALTFIMKKFNCCGAINGSDFSNSSSFQRSQKGKQLKYPPLCCKSDTSKTGEQKCNSKVDTFHIGCAKRIHEKYLRLTDIFAYLTIVVYLVNIITIVMGIMVLSIPPHQKPKKLSGDN
uniref:Tetraspanin n=1 Tax=Trichobilharzia regenti TaxID=157069 RepID=A0AA85J7W1_TRIRE|nr:unnamed protein product [Trichobilharzia regenti]